MRKLSLDSTHCIMALKWVTSPKTDSGEKVTMMFLFRGYILICPECKAFDIGMLLLSDWYHENKGKRKKDYKVLCE